MVTQQEALERRLEKAKNAPAKPSKAERLAGVVARSSGKDDAKREAGEVKMPEGGPSIIPQTKTPKKPSQTVKDWKALDKGWPDEKLKIHILVKDKNPKRGKAADRFNLYRNGMSVSQYIEECKKLGTARGAALQDVRWDFVKKFIDVK